MRVVGKETRPRTKSRMMELAEGVSLLVGFPSFAKTPFVCFRIDLVNCGVGLVEYNIYESKSSL